MQQYLNHVNNKLIEVAEQKINKIYRYYLSKDISYDLLKKVTLEDLLIINKNANGEILTVDFDLEKSYKAIDEITDVLITNINNLEQGKVNFNDKNIIPSSKGLILKFPLFLASDYALLSNLGPDVYLQVNFIGTVLTNIKTKVTNYGMNNALIEIYATIEISEELITPVTKNIQKIDYDILLASKVINGRVPEFYGGTLTTDSKIINQELTAK